MGCATLARMLAIGGLLAVTACGGGATPSPMPSGGNGGAGSSGVAASGAAPGAAGMAAAGNAGSAAGSAALGGAGAPGVLDAGVAGAAGAMASDAAAPTVDAATAVPAGSSAAALEQLDAWLASARDARPALTMQPFATVPLTRADAESARQRLWDDFAAVVRATRAAEVGATKTSAKSVQAAGKTMKYYMAVLGDEPADGRSLFISMHGGGNTTAATNDSQWENQISLVDGYNPKDAIWVAPRAPSDDWNMWFTPEIDPLFERLITDLIVFEGINPNKVYINGYSAGGDAVYQLGPRMAERWAGAAMSAGHPNDATPVNLRNLAFAIHVGGDDTAYDRNKKAQEWGEQLDELAAMDPGSYPHQWQVHAGLPHWMNLEDAVAIPFVQGFTRDPVPDKVVWRQVNVTRSRMYWLAVDQANQKSGTEIRASYSGDTVSIESSMNLNAVAIRFSDAMLDLDAPVHIERAGSALFSGMVPRTIEVIDRTLEESGDPTMAFSGEVKVSLQ